MEASSLHQIKPAKAEQVKLWTIVKLSDTEELDVLPNLWIDRTDNKAEYPEGTRALVTKFAKNVEDPKKNKKLPFGSVDWEIVPIEIIEEDYEDFQVAMEDAIRFTQGKRSKAESEKETGRGRRIKKSRRLISSSEADDSSEERPKQKSSKTRPIPEFIPQPVPQAPLIFSKEIFSDEPEKMQRPSTSSSQDEPEKVQRPSTSSSQTVKAKKPPHSQSPEKKAEKLCPLKKNKKHNCACTTKAPTLQEMASALCILSRDVQRLRELYEKTSSIIISLLEELKEDEESSESENEETTKKIDEILKDAPFKTMEEFNNFDSQLAADGELTKEVIIRCQKAIKSVGKLASAARTVVRIILTTDLQREFSWKGQAVVPGSNEAKVAFCNTSFCQCVLYKTLKASKNWPKKDLEKTVKETLSSMFTMANTKKGSKKAAGNIPQK